MCKIKPQLFFDRLGEALTNSLEIEIRDDYVNFFDWLKERVVCNAREQKRDSNFNSPPRWQIVQAEKGFQ
jgi:hypothetical protein